MTDSLFDLRICRFSADELLKEVAVNAKTPLEVALAAKLEEALNEISNLQFELEEAQ